MYELITNKISIETDKIKYLSDFIGDDYKTKWQKGDLIFIDSQMGKGKSYFVLNVLAAKRYGMKKVLILTNRDELKQEFIKHLEHSKKLLGNITVMNYQSLEKSQIYNKQLEEYDYIVCDEAHYFLEDSYTNATNISFDWIMNQDNSIKVFMTATSQKINPMIEAYTRNDSKEYRVHYYWLKSDYSYMDVMKFDFSSRKIIDFLMNTIDKEHEKILYFTYSIDEGDKIYGKYPDDTSRIYSKYRKENLEKITQNAIDNGKCINIITIATKCIDNGISIKDASIKYIVADIKEPISLIQCLGRKRMKYDGVVEDKVRVYLRDWTKSCKKRADTYRYRLNKLNEQEKAIENKEYRIISEKLWGFQDYYCGIDDNGKPLYEKRVNPLYRLALEQQIEEFENMSKGEVIEFHDGKEIIRYFMNYYEKVVNMLTNCNQLELDYVETIDSQQAIEICKLYSVTGEYDKKLNIYWFDNDIYKELVEKLNIQNKSGVIRKIGLMNRKLEVNSVPYRIESKRKIKNGKRMTYYYVHYHETDEGEEE